MPFLTLTAVFLFIGPVLIIGIATMWSNLKQKISDELSACVTRIINDLHTKNNTPEIDSKLTVEINTKITNELSAHLSEINSTFTAELNRINNDFNNKLNEEVNAGFSKINTELNGKLTAKAKKNEARDDNFIRKAQKILNDITTKVNNIGKACRNEFSRINVVIEDLQNKINQHYAVVQRSNFD
ncbi:hypothetical protein C1646_661131 [Rhizophagus diaphanus]|nr:hypothetical protein C1646_661131 [Rhizophagus diaphanus] [Rhizophagus sp. MUCL 43196]